MQGPSLLVQAGNKLLLRAAQVRHSPGSPAVPSAGETGQYLHAPGSPFKGILAFSTQYKVRKTGELNPNSCDY